MQCAPASDMPQAGIQLLCRVKQQQVHAGNYAIDRTAQSRSGFHLAIRDGLVKVAGWVRVRGHVTNFLENNMQFQGTDKYVATDDLKMAVNASIALKRPLLIK